MAKAEHSKERKQHAGNTCAMTTVMVFAAACALSCAALGETFAWKHAVTSSSVPASPNWQSFGTAANWAVGTDKTGTNPNGLVPGVGDFIYYGAEVNYVGTVQAFDFDGESYAVAGLASGMTGSGKHSFLLRNGTLEFTDNFTNRCAQVYVYDTGKFIVGSSCSSLCGGSGLLTLIKVYDGGEADIGGTIDVHFMRMEVESGGVMTFRPKTFAFHNTANKDNGDTWLKNSGMLNIPKNISLTGYSGKRPCVFSIEQNAGILTLGGNIKNSQYGDVFDFTLAGGTVNVTNNVAFSNMRTVRMAEGATVTVNVDVGKTFDLSTMTFASGTTLTKTGAGTLKLGASVPETLYVEGGILAASAATSFGGLLLSPGVTLHIASVCVSFGAISGIASANITFDSSLTSSIAALLSSSDPATLSALMEKLGNAPEGWEYRVDGDTLFLDKVHDPSVFYWKRETTGAYDSFFDASYWGVGKTSDSTNPDGLVPGADDWIYYGNAYQRYLTFNMGGMHRIVKGIANGLNPDKEAWGYCHIWIQNGILEFSTSFTNRCADIKVDSGGKFVLGENCATLAGNGSLANAYAVNSGGECDLGGFIYMDVMQSTIAAGGSMTFRPRAFEFSTNAKATQSKSYMYNSGSLEIPSGFTLGGSAGTHPCVFTLWQKSGSLTLGGDLTMVDASDKARFILSGGTVNATSNVAFVGFDSVIMTNDASTTVNVAAGKTLDLTAMSFLGGTSLVKTGDGSLRIGDSAPSALSVESGRLVLGGSAVFGDGLSLDAGASLLFAAGGSSASAIAGMSEADITVDAAILRLGTTLLKSTSTALLDEVRQKLSAQVAALTNSRRGLEVRPAADEPGVYHLKVVSRCGVRVIVW